MEIYKTIYGRGTIFQPKNTQKEVMILLDIPRYNNKYFALYLNELKYDIKK